MKAENQYLEDYITLHIKPGCSLAELRKTYKTQIQKWHPDRFGTDPVKQQAAYDKIKNINAAYNALVSFHKKNGRLPQVEAAELQKQTKPRRYEHSQTVTDRPEQTSESRPGNKAREAATGKRPKRRKKGSLLISATLIAIIIYTYNQFSSDQYSKNNLQEYDHQAIHSTVNTKPGSNGYNPKKTEQRESDIANQEPTKNEEERSERYFTYGSTIGDVISVQGPPSKIEDGVWYYNDSKVYFENGKVARWVRTPSMPLKAKSIIKPSNPYK